ncbi:MAG TPA: histidine kinase [Gemmatimonadaceae bacterium]|nr:histidine kinase [Gemmatimonadaceae bacterium]
MNMTRTRGWLLAIGAAFLYTAAQTFELARAIKDVPVLELYLFELPVWLSALAITPIVFWIARRLPLFGPGAGRNFLAHLPLASVVLLLMFVLIEFTRRVVIRPIVLGAGIASTPAALKYANFDVNLSVLTNAWDAFRVYVVFFLFVYFAAVVLHHSMAYRRELNAERLRAQELQTMLAKSQLDSLRLQLHPHFLFNTLNTVSSLMTRDVSLARRTLSRLSDLLRETLRDATTHEVSLGSELEFLDAYIDIQSARFGARLVVEKRIEPAATRILVPRMLLQPLVENSIHHGMRDGDSTLVIRVSATVNAESIELSVVDNGAGLRNRKLAENVGLRNTRERLERLYGTQQEIRVESEPGQGFSVTLRLPARLAPIREEQRERGQREREIA